MKYNQNAGVCYVTSRLAVVQLGKLSPIQTLIDHLSTNHGKYFHIFNLTQVSIVNEEMENKFKWRGIPFSFVQTLKITKFVDKYLRNNQANSAILVVASKQALEYAFFIFRFYITIINISIGRSLIQKMSFILPINYNSTFKQFIDIYKTQSIINPPIRIIERIKLEKANFIPMFYIYTESRYNQFQLVYKHEIASQLVQYYLSLHDNLQTGIGQHFYTNQPQTQYLTKPVVIYGDTKIVFYSFQTHKLQQKFIIGFNTLNIIKNGDLQFKLNDLYGHNYNQQAGSNSITTESSILVQYKLHKDAFRNNVREVLVVSSAGKQFEKLVYVINRPIVIYQYSLAVINVGNMQIKTS